MKGIILHFYNATVQSWKHFQKSVTDLAANVSETWSEIPNMTNEEPYKFFIYMTQNVAVINLI